MTMLLCRYVASVNQALREHEDEEKKSTRPLTHKTRTRLRPCSRIQSSLLSKNGKPYTSYRKI